MTETAQTFANAAAFDWEDRDIGMIDYPQARALYRAKAFAPAATDEASIILVPIDMQNDFCHPKGALYVGGRDGTGALGDTYKVASFIYRNLARITKIIPTLDTHLPGQIFFTSFWQDANGNEPAPFTVIAPDDVRGGRYRPSPTALASLPEYVADYPGLQDTWVVNQVQHYVDALAESGKYSLILWPYHCLEGTPGHNLAAPVLEAAMCHQFLRDSPLYPRVKGDEPWTESYSVFRNEVEADHRNVAFDGRIGRTLSRQLTQDPGVGAVIIAGEASSHCVMSSVDDLLKDGTAIDPTFPSRVYVMRDCMSAVVTKDTDGNIIPGLDFTDAAEDAFTRWAAAGVNIVQSTVAMEEWPGMAEILERNGQRSPTLG